jgi:hypothetical protein
MAENSSAAYLNVSLKSRSAAIFHNNTTTTVFEANGNKVSHQLCKGHVSGGVTYTLFATIFCSESDRFYRAFDIVELDGQDYVFSCAILASVNGAGCAIVVALNTPVAQYFDGKHNNLRTRYLEAKKCMEFPVNTYLCTLQTYIAFNNTSYFNIADTEKIT